MHILGLLGGVASGKSLVAGQLERLGAGVLDADRAGHEVLRMPEVEQAARERWGEAVFRPDGHIDRHRLAAIVFAPPPKGSEERRFLEELTHPRIRRLLEKEANGLAAAGFPAAVLDAPLLLEAGWDTLCHRLILVDAPGNCAWPGPWPAVGARANLLAVRASRNRWTPNGSVPMS